MTLAAERAIEDSVVSSLACGIAERLAAKVDGTGAKCRTAAADGATAREMLSWLNDNYRQTDAHLWLCQVRAEGLVQRWWPQILALADVLLTERTMEYRRGWEVANSVSPPNPTDLGQERTGPSLAGTDGHPIAMTQVGRHDASDP